MKEYIIKVILWKGGVTFVRAWGMGPADAYQAAKAANPNIANMISTERA